LLYLLAGNCLYRIGGEWFRLSREQFNAFQYGGIVLYKLGIVLFNLVPYIVLRFVR